MHIEYDIGIDKMRKLDEMNYWEKKGATEYLREQGWGFLFNWYTSSAWLDKR